MVSFPSKLKRREFLSISMLLFFLFALGGALYLSQRPQEIREKAVEPIVTISPTPIPEYAEGEVLIKFESNIQTPKVKLEPNSTEMDIGSKPILISNIVQDSLPPSLKSNIDKYKINQIEKVFKGVGTPQQELDKFKKKFPERVLFKNPGIDALSIDLSRTYRISFDQNESIEKIIDDLKKFSDVEYVEPNYHYQKDSDPNDPYYLDVYPNSVSGRDPSWNPPHDYQWNIKKTNSSNNWQIDSSGVIVAVLDTGVDVNHGELGNVWVNQSEVANNNIDDDNNGCIDDIYGCNTASYPVNGNIADDNNHGTHVAGVISAKTNNSVGVAGMTNNAKIMVVKVLWADGYGTAGYIADGVRYAVNNGANIINMSLGGSFSQTLKEALDYAISHNVIPVVAAGNGNFYSPSHFPASYPKAITVGAVDEELNKLNYSNYGPNIDVVAPGGGKPCNFWDKPSYCSNILSLKSSQNNNDLEHVVGGQYLRMSGTSMATPHVAGIIALLLAQHPAFGIEEAENYIRFNSIDRYTQGYDEQTGWGLITADGNKFVTNSNISFDFRFPFDNSLVGNHFNIEGIISSDNFDHYTLQYRLKGTSEWKTNGVMLINEGLSPIIPVSPKTVAKIAEIFFPENTQNGEHEVKITFYMTNNESLVATKYVSYLGRSQTSWYFQENSENLPASGNILVSDINNDNNKEIILFNHGFYDQKKLAVYDKNYNLLWQKEDAGKQVVVGDIDNRFPGKEIIQQTVNQIKVFSASGDEISDMNLNVSSTSNIIIVENIGTNKDDLCFIQNAYMVYSLVCYEQNTNNQLERKFSVGTDSPSTKISWPVTGDVNGDSQKEILVSKNRKLSIIGLSGSIISQHDFIGYPLVLVDIDKDGKEEMATYFNDAVRVLKLNNTSDIQEVWNYPIPNANPQLAVADFNNDTFPDLYFHNNYAPNNELIIDHSGNQLYSSIGPFYSSFSEGLNFALGDRDGNGKTEIYISGQMSVDSRSYLSLREFDPVTHQFNYLDGFWKSIYPGCNTNVSWYNCSSSNDIKLALIDLNNNGKLDLIISGIGIIEYATIGIPYWPYRYHDYHRTNSYNFIDTGDFSSPTPTPLPELSKVMIQPPEIAIKLGDPPVGLSALAYDSSNRPIWSGVSYEWGISSQEGIGSVHPTSGNITNFTPYRYGNGQIYVIARYGGQEVTKAIPVHVTREIPTLFKGWNRVAMPGFYEMLPPKNCPLYTSKWQGLWGGNLVDLLAPVLPAVDANRIYVKCK